MAHGLKAYFRTYNIPSADIPFVSRVPEEAVALAATVVSYFFPGYFLSTDIQELAQVLPRSMEHWRICRGPVSPRPVFKLLHSYQ